MELTIPLCLLKILDISPSFHLFLSFHQDTYLPVEASNAPTDVVTDEPAKGEVDARGIIEERRRLGEINEYNLPVTGVEIPTPPQTVTVHRS